MKSLGFYEKRLEDLENNITEDQKLLKQYEDVLRYESDPRAIGKCEREIERQRESVTRYQQEYAELKQELINYQPTQLLYVEKQLQQLDDKINVLLKGQIAIYKNQQQIRQALLKRYNASEKAIIGSITQQLNQTQLVLTENLLQALENNMLSEPEMQQMLAVLEERLPSLPPSQAAIAEIIKDPEMDARHKLKVTLPIIPMLVEYEGELELGSGFNIKSAWQQLMTKLRRR
ncbi:hypothetical protein H6G81_17800 [Scytonema hofmannii FACHB-248]|uniref:Uncharacterized protein n=1 Tax=Scytonema hofmannii FACHB-248 TaxID=1842502 RepID=A0ABR8GS90_9CYAN|nr:MULTISPECIES: hypothetical protein [Nostocales]MBD2606334.1 hypothetical protein [Scytonema hofmannii FACHB-248]